MLRSAAPPAASCGDCGGQGACRCLGGAGRRRLAGSRAGQELGGHPVPWPEGLGAARLGMPEHPISPSPLLWEVGGGRRQRDPHAPDAVSLGQRGWHVSAELREGVGTLADSASGSLGFTKSAELSAAPPADASHTDGPSRGSHPHPLSGPHPHPLTRSHPHPLSRSHPHPLSRPRPHPLSRPHQATPPCTCLSESAARVHPRPWGCPPRGGPESPAQRAGTCPALTG